MSSSDETVSTPRPYAVNIAWTALGAAGNMLSMALVSPVVIRNLGPEGYGVWTMVFSLVSYSAFFDLGSRPALIHYTALLHGKSRSREISDLLNSVIAYYCIGAFALTCCGLAIAPYAPALFSVSPSYSDEFSALVCLVGGMAALGLNPFNACLEGLQRFDISVKIYVVMLLARVFGSLTVLLMGFGIVPLAMVYVGGQVLTVVLGWIACRRLLPSFRLRPRLRGPSELREMASYAYQSAFVSIAGLILSHSAPLIIGHLMSASAVGFFGLPYRLMQYSGDIVVRTGNVTATNLVTSAASRDWGKLVSVSVVANRLGVIVYAPIVIFLATLGEPFLALWVGREYAEKSSTLVLILVISSAISIGGQFHSSAVLFALKRQRLYGVALMLEAAVSVGAMFYLIPRFGLQGGAIAVAVPMVILRAGYVPWALCRRLDYSIVRYWSSIYGTPTVTAVVVWLMVHVWLPTPESWLGMVGAGGFITSSYGLIAWWVCLTGDQRARLRALVNRVVIRSRGGESPRSGNVP